MRKTTSRKNKLKWNDLSKELRTKIPYCEVCKTETNLQCHHLISKFWMKSRLRFDEQNIVVVCPTCHFTFHKNPISSMEWLKTTKQNDYNYLLNIVGRLVVSEDNGSKPRI